MFEQLLHAGEKKGIRRDSSALKRYKKEMVSLLKADIAILLYSTESFYAVQLWSDLELQEALQQF